MRRVLVVCIGNALVADDGVGQAVYEMLKQRALAEDVRVEFMGLGGIDLLDVLEGEQLLIVVDSVQLGRPPGSICQLEWQDIPSMDLRPVSGHGIGIREAIDIGRKLYPEKMPGSAVLIGIEGKCFDQLGAGLSEEVARSVPLAVEKILELAARLPKG